MSDDTILGDRMKGYEAATRAVLAAIDDVTADRCGHCDRVLGPDAPSGWWCGPGCQQAWTTAQQGTAQLPDGPEDISGYADFTGWDAEQREQAWAVERGEDTPAAGTPDRWEELRHLLDEPLIGGTIWRFPEPSSRLAVHLSGVQVNVPALVNFDDVVVIGPDGNRLHRGALTIRDDLEAELRADEVSPTRAVQRAAAAEQEAPHAR